MNIKLWDYSREPFNLQGIICLRFSLAWAALGAFYYFLIHPRIVEALLWFSQNLAFSFVVGMFYGIFLVDLVYSLGIVARVRRFAVDNQILIRYEELKEEIRQQTELKAAERHEKVARIRFLLSFKSEIPLSEHLERYRDIHQAFQLGPKDMLGELKDELQERNEDLAEKVEAVKETVKEAASEKIEELIAERQEELESSSRTGRQR